MLLDFNLTNVYYCDIAIMAMSARIRDKQNTKVSDHKFFQCFQGKKLDFKGEYKKGGSNFRSDLKIKDVYKWYHVGFMLNRVSIAEGVGFSNKNVDQR